MDFSFTVFPKPAALFKPSKRTLDNPAFGQNVEIMLFTSLYHLYFGFAERFHCIGKFSACITAIDKDLFYGRQRTLVQRDHLQCPSPVRHVCGGYKEGVRQTQCIHKYMKFDSGNFFAAVLSFFLCDINSLYAFGIYNAK